MTVEANYYDWKTNTLHVVCPVIPKEVRVTQPDKRGRDVYTARVYRFVPKGKDDRK